MADLMIGRSFNPFREIDRVRGEMHRLFGDALLRMPAAEWAESGFPPVDVYATEGEMVLVAEVPGLGAEQIQITTTKDTITIAGEFTQPSLPEQAEALRQERSYGRFTRTFRLPLPVDADKAQAKIKDGLLMIHVPKADEIRPRTIPIDVN